MSNLHKQMEKYTGYINTALDAYLIPDEKGYDEVWEAMRYSVMNAGKRIRPILVLEFCRVHGGDINDAMPFACAVEMIHCYSLIHDDLPCMDDDDMRRGKPSCHKQFGESTALLAGDALLTRAFEIIAASDFSKQNPNLAVKALSELAVHAGAAGMIGGQILDLKGEKTRPTSESLKQTHCLKTAALIKVSCIMGAVCAKADDAAVTAAGAYGENLGLAFQLIDDILDITGDEDKLGKPIGSDEINGKTTFITLLGMKETEKLAKEYTKCSVNMLSKLQDCGFLTELAESLLNRIQ